MKTYLDCIPCFLKQSLEAARMTNADEKTQERVIKKIMKYFQNIDFNSPPPEISREAHAIIREITCHKDPYKKVKQQSNKMAEKEYTHLKKLVENSDDPLFMAIKLSIVGNIIDFGTSNRFKLEEMIDNAVEKKFSHDAYPYFKKVLKKSDQILFLGDNAGEIFFDKLLLEEIKKLHPNKKIFYVVKSNPIINDATDEDAIFAGVDEYAEVIKGDEKQPRSAPGMILDYASEEFLDKLEETDMVISKGQGNYEALSDINREVFFLLMVKCPLVARDIGEKMKEFVLKVKK
ncbi:MAG: ARMT1-like domain-containing protein [Candidatus Thermoplasmatota archaeon]